ncbi:tudor domain-containing protein 1 [Protopterus annectens]|uniref:tudor domain-containing protein 1 n=1 Tax=Protopterus annectens TaxID=7888 RepID=UPI001CF98836|nr:tudor domain-containing protein 1 [Protopterus annectens]
MGSLRCSRCKQTYYCSVLCQKYDWPAHRNVCNPLSTTNSKPEKCRKLPEEKTPNDLKAHVPINSTIKNASDVKARVRLSDLKYFELKRGQQVQVGVTEIESPGKIFVQVCTQESFEFLSSLAMAKRGVAENTSSDQYIPEIGEICAAKYSDFTWHRILIKNIDVAHGTAQVFYIDYGNDEEITLDRIKALFEDMKQFPPCAVKCFIGSVAPVDQAWSEACTISIRQLILGKTCKMNILAVYNNATEFAVDFMLPDTGESLSKYLVEKGYALNIIDKNKAECNRIDDGMEKTTLNSSIKGKVFGNQNNADKSSGRKLISLSFGDVFSAVVAHVQSPEYFFCQMMENGTHLAELQAALAEHCTKTPSNPEFRPAVGALCCAMFTGDNQWYRASVIKYGTEDRVTVGYVDYGNFEVLHYSRLRPLMAKFMELPLQAITCSLAGVKSTSDTWLPEASSILKKIVNNKVLAARVIDKKQNRVELELIDKSSDPFIDVAEQLVLAGFAKKVDKEQSIVEVRDGLTGWEPVHPGNKITTECIELSVKQSLKVIVCFISSPGDFFCQRCNTEDLFALNKLNKSLNDYCEKHPPSNTFKLLYGEPCCAFFKSDGNWYRAVGKQCSVKVTKVQFVDYGNEIETTVEKLRPIPSEFLELPFQAIHCCMAGIKPVSTDWTAEATARFQELTVGLELQASVKSVSNMKASVELKSSSSGSFTDISELLVQEHLAVRDDKILDVPTVEKCSGIPSPLQWKAVELPLNKHLTIQILEVANNGLFYAAQTAVKADGDKLHALMNEMAKYFWSQGETASCRPKLGEACCARFTGDDNWYRAIAMETFDTKVKVVYADFGNIETIPYARIRPITAEFLEFPFSVVKCTLAGLNSVSGKWLPESKELLQTLVLKENVKVIVREVNNNIHFVSLVKNGIEGTTKMTDNMEMEGTINYDHRQSPDEPHHAGCCCKELKKQVDEHEKILAFLLSRLESSKE